MQVKEVDCVVVKTELPVTKPEPEPTPAAAVTTPQSTTPPRVTSSEKKSRRHTGDDMVYHCPPPAKVWKGLKYKYWSPGALQPAVKYKRPTDKEITEVMKYICGDLTVACTQVKWHMSEQGFLILHPKSPAFPGRVY